MNAQSTIIFDSIEDVDEDELEEDVADQQIIIDSALETFATIKGLIQKDSEGALAKKTVSDYENLWKQFLAHTEEMHPAIGYRNLQAATDDCPYYCAAWIRSVCDYSTEDSSTATLLSKNIPESSLPLKVLRPQNSSKRMRRDKPATYTHAIKMRSALSFGFVKYMKYNPTVWQKQADGKNWGNPSLSAIVTTYMRSLRKKKMHAGEVATSARAITKDDLRKLWVFNEDIPPLSFGEKLENFDDEVNFSRWGGGRVRSMLQCIYLLSFICLLRFDEVLQIQLHHLTVENEAAAKISLNLIFRKTKQEGGIKPFMLWPNPLEPWLCPVRALLKWVKLSGLTEGFLFRTVNANDQVSSANKQLTSTVFSRYFNQNLVDVDLDFTHYGTHSFRRGGCQYFYSEKRWDVRRVADWGGWSANYDSSSIIRYLLNWNDQPSHDRDHYLNPRSQRGSPCVTCGRTCPCN